MKTGADVLNEILNELNLRAPTLAKNIGLPHYRLSDIQTGRVKKISGEMAHAINKRYPQYSIEYLLTGEGNTASNEVNGSNNVIGNHNKVGHDDVINKLAGITDKVELTYTKGGLEVRRAKPKCDLVSTHTARRTGATLLVKAGAPIAWVMKVTGHKSEKTFMRYIRLSSEEYADLVRGFMDKI